jgi:hypothetical protein
MTILAHIGGVDVGGVFAGGVHAIVTRRTVAGYRTVIKLSVVPRVGVVAVLTSIATCDVVCRLTLGDCTVVTRLTAANDGTVINARYSVPVLASVATFTIVGDLDVCQRDDTGRALCVTSVALDARSWCALENAPRVTTIAYDTLVRAIERESG